MSEIFVIMPFGHKQVLIDGTVTSIDFDDVYKQLVSPACQKAGHTSARIDEMSFSGAISSEIIQRLFSSDIVIADLTGGNENVFFELGIRQSLTERPTILIALVGTRLPFDVHDQRVSFYNLSTKDSQIESIARLSTSITSVGEIGSRSPILSRLRELGIRTDPRNPSQFEADLRQKISRASSLEQLTAVWYWCSDTSPLPPYLLLDLAERISAYDEWNLASEIARRASIYKPDDFEIHRKIGWFLRNIGPEEYESAEREFKKAIELNPSDPETLGLLGGLMKRMRRYKEATEFYDAGYRLSPSSKYMRVNRAAMQLLHDLDEGGGGTDDGISAYRDLYDTLLPSSRDLSDAWDYSVLGECAFVLGETEKAFKFFQEASEAATSPTVLESPADQIELFASFGFREELASTLVDFLRKKSAPESEQTRLKILGSSSRPTDSGGPTPVIVHLSDIHFGSKLSGDGAPQNMHRFQVGDYSQPLITHMNNELVKSKSRFCISGKPAVVVASGDFSYTATPEEFSEVLEFFEALKRLTDLPPERFVFCPGNHDVNWALSSIDINKRFDNYISFLKKFYGDKLLKELYPMIKWDFSFDGERPDPTDLVSVFYYKEAALLFASFNSCVYETEQHHYGYISLKQQQKISNLIDNFDIPEDVVRVAVVHHHVHPFPEFVDLNDKDGHWVDMSTIRDGGLFERFLGREGFDIVLHGHKHQPQLRETLVRDRSSGAIGKHLIVCGAGSCGVASTELAHSTGNQYQVLEVVGRPRTPGSNFLRVEWREISLEPASEWATTKVWNVLGG